MYTILFVNQKGGVGKTTLADELSFALERANDNDPQTVKFVAIDPQGGAVHEADESDDDNYRYQVVDTAGVLSESLGEWVAFADMVIIPMLPSTRDMEPTFRTYEVAAKAAGKDTTVGIVVNQYNPFGVLDKQLDAYLTDNEMPVIAKVPKSVSFSQAAGEGCSVLDLPRTKQHVRDAIEGLAQFVAAKEAAVS